MLGKKPYENLNETELLSLIVQKYYSGFIPVPNATAGLDEYEPLSIMKCRKRKRNELADNEPSTFGKKIAKMAWTCFRGEKEAQEHPVQLHPAEVFDQTPTKTPLIQREMKKIGERSSAFELNSTSEWNASCKTPSSPPLPKSDQVQAPHVSLKWKADNKAPSIDLGNIYERVVKRRNIRRWLKDHHHDINQEELKALKKTSDLFIICHVLYSDKIIIRHGSSSGEKKLDVESRQYGSASASSTFHTQGPTAAVTIRSEDVGKKPIAFKVTELLITKKNRRLKLHLPPQRYTNMDRELPRRMFHETDSTGDSPSPTNSSDEGSPSVSKEDIPTPSTPPSHRTRALRSTRPTESQ